MFLWGIWLALVVVALSATPCIVAVFFFGCVRFLLGCLDYIFLVEASVMPVLLQA